MMSNLRDKLTDYVKRFIKFVEGKKEEIQIPEDWKNPQSLTTKTKSNPTPVAVKPHIVFESSGTKILSRIPGLKIKRVMAFFLFIASILASVEYIISFPPGLIFFIPAAIIFLDYLIRTQPKNLAKWYMLDDVEEE